MIPTTKPKQRLFVADLIRQVEDMRDALREMHKALTLLHNHLHNRTPTPGRRSAPRRRNLRALILATKRANPRMNNQEIGHMLQISSGRVSEAFRGKRT